MLAHVGDFCLDGCGETKASASADGGEAAARRVLLVAAGWWFDCSRLWVITSMIAAADMVDVC